MVVCATSRLALLVELNQVGQAAEALRQELGVRVDVARRQAAAELDKSANAAGPAEWFTRSRTLLRSGDAASAVVAARDGLTHHPQDVPLRHVLAHALIAQGRNLEAVSEFSVASAGGVDAEVAMVGACLYAQHGNMQKAIRQLLDVTRRVPTASALHSLHTYFSIRPAGSDQASSGLPDGDLLRFLLMARCKAYAGDIATAKALTMLCLDRDPLWHPVYTTLATILLLEQKPQPALVAVDFALQLSPKDRWAKALEALCLSANGSHDTALLRLNEIPIAVNGQAHLSYAVAYLYELSGLLDRAEREALNHQVLRAAGVDITARKTPLGVLTVLARYEDDLMPPLLPAQ